jgi:hypothetical protein
VKGHTHAFCEAAGTEQSADLMLVGARALGMTAADVVYKPGLLDEMRTEFQARKETARR